MARILGLGNPNVSGRIGNIVYTTYKQGVIAKAYQPKVSNPRSSLQVSQRERFTLANRYVTKAANESKRLYGTGQLKFERAALMQSILKSRLLKNYGGNFSLAKPRLVILPNKENTQLFTTIGKNYDKEKLNIFDFGVTMDFTTNDDFGKFEHVWSYKTLNTSWLINGSFNNNPTENQYYFGCDYVLPDTISISQIVGVDELSAPSFSTKYLKLKKIVVSGGNFSTGRNRGLYTALEDCGGDWKYYYSVMGKDLNQVEESLYPAQAVVNNKVVSTVAVACVMIISASSYAVGEENASLGGSIDTVISITAQDVLNIPPVFEEQEPGH